MNTPPTILKEPDITSILQVVHNSEKTTFALREHFRPDIPPECYFSSVDELRYTNYVIGELGSSHPALTSLVHKDQYKLGFLR